VSSNFALVTGAAGFIGDNLVRRLLEENRHVIALDCFLLESYSPEIKRDRWKGLSDLRNQKLVQIEFDLRSDNFDAFRNFEITSVFHLAAMPGLMKNWMDAEIYYSCNLFALNRFLEFLRPIPLESFVHASTSSVYGKHAVGNELVETRPSSPYGVSKLAAEKLIQAYADNYGLPAKILRYFSVYGPGQRPDMAFAKIIRAISEQKVFEIHGDGFQSRSNTYVDDVVDATVRAEKSAQVGDILNICGDEQTTLNQAISLIESIMQKELLKVRVESRKGDQRETAGINSLARERLRWSAQVGIEEGLSRQIGSFLNPTNVVINH